MTDLSPYACLGQWVSARLDGRRVAGEIVAYRGSGGERRVVLKTGDGALVWVAYPASPARAAAERGAHR